MDDPKLRHLQARYKHLLEQLGHAPDYMFQHQLHTHPLQEGSPHVELVDGRYHYVVTERGKELQRRIAEDEDELLYWLMSDVTAGIAQRLDRRRWFRSHDSRRWWFGKGVELLTKLRPEWGDRRRAEYAEILRAYPDRGKNAVTKQGRSWWPR